MNSVRRAQHDDNYREIDDVDSVDFDEFDATGTDRRSRLRLM